MSITYKNHVKYKIKIKYYHIHNKDMYIGNKKQCYDDTSVCLFDS